MKKYLFLLVSIFVMTNLSLFALENSIIKVNDSKWDFKIGNDAFTFIFTLKGYEPEDPDERKKPTIPTIIIKTCPAKKEYQYWKDDDKTLLKNFKKHIEDNFKNLKEDTRKKMTAQLKSKNPNISDSRIDDYIEKEIGTPEMFGTYIKTFGGHKGILGEYSIKTAKFKIINILTLKRDVSIIVTNSVNTDIDSLPAYKEFMSSLEIKDRKATYLNALFFANLNWIIFGAIVLFKVLYEVYKRTVR